MASQTEENYLKLLYVLTRKNKEVKISALGASLNVSLPTINSMMKNLSNQGLVHYEKYKPVSLTKKGTKEAALVLRKHRLVEMYLVNKMGFGWEEVHDIAEQIEHINSPAFFQRIDELLGFPSNDPHGSPIPNKNGEVTFAPKIILSHCNTGEVVRLIALTHSPTDFLNYLTNRELSLGTELKIMFIEPYDKSMTLSYQGHPSEVFSKIICDSLLVEYVND